MPIVCVICPLPYKAGPENGRCRIGSLSRFEKCSSSRRPWNFFERYPFDL